MPDKEYPLLVLVYITRRPDFKKRMSTLTNYLGRLFCSRHTCALRSDRLFGSTKASNGGFTSSCRKPTFWLR